MYNVYISNNQGFNILKPLNDRILMHSQEIQDEAYKLIDPVYKQSINSSGSFEFKMHKKNVAYSLVERMVSSVMIERDGKPFWVGRVLDYEMDLYGIKSVVCEGALSFLNDSVQLPEEHSGSISEFFTRLLTRHNQQVYGARAIHYGNVTVTDSNDYIKRYMNYETTLDCLNEKLLETHGGYFVIRYGEDNVIYLDYLQNPTHTSGQEIRFGENIIDYAENYNWDDLATVLVPRGCYLEESPISALYAYLTVDSVNGGSPFVYADNTVLEKYGKITKVMDWPDVTVAQNLLTKATNYLSSQQFDTMTITVKAVDLHVLTPGTEAFNLFDEVRVVCPPVGLDKKFQLSEINIPLDSPEDAEYVLGKDTLESLSKSVSSSVSSLKEIIKELPTKQDILKEAKDEASAMIQTAGVNGYVTVVTENGVAKELLITDNPDYHQAMKVWRWNLGGLGYSNKGYNGPYITAMTMNGGFVADFITTGTMLADRINGGSLKLGEIGTVDGGDIEIYANTYPTGQTSPTKVKIGGLNSEMWFFKSYYRRPDNTDIIIRRFLCNDNRLLRAENSYLNACVTGWRTSDETVNVPAVQCFISGNSIVMGYANTNVEEPNNSDVFKTGLRIGSTGASEATPSYAHTYAITASKELRLGAKIGVTSAPPHIVLWDDDYYSPECDSYSKVFKVRFNRNAVTFKTFYAPWENIGAKEIQILPTRLYAPGDQNWYNRICNFRINKIDSDGNPQVALLRDSGGVMNFTVVGNFAVTGSKRRLVKTENYGMRAMNAFETAECHFSDIGSGVVNSDGICRVDFDPIFMEVIDQTKPYQVLITRCSEEEAKWVEKHDNYFIVHGDPGAKFDWMLICKQIDYSDVRMKEEQEPVNPGSGSTIFNGGGVDGNI